MAPGRAWRGLKTTPHSALMTSGWAVVREETHITANTLTHSSSRSHVMTNSGRVENPGPRAARHTHAQSEGEANPLPDATGNYANVVCVTEMVMLLRVHRYICCHGIDCFHDS